MKKVYKHQAKINVVLLECEVDIILQALLDFNYGVNKEYNFRKKSITESEEKDKMMARLVYEHIFLTKIDLRKQKEEIEKREREKEKIEQEEKIA